MIEHRHGLFVDNPKESSKLVVYARGFGKKGELLLIRLKVFEMPLKSLMEEVDAFELMVTIEEDND